MSNIPTTTVERTIFDLFAIKERRAERALDYSIIQRLTSLSRMWLLHDEQWTRGRRGIRLMRDQLVHRTAGEGPSRSSAERMMTQLIREQGFPRPEREYEVMLPFGPVHIDFAYPEIKFGIETDDYSTHGDNRSFDRDRERDAELIALGWIIIRVTWSQLRYRPAYVANKIRDILVLREALPSAPLVSP